MQDNQMQDFTHEVVASKGGNALCGAPLWLVSFAGWGKTWKPAYEALNIQEPIPTNAVVLSPDFEYDGVVLGGVLGGVLVSKNGGQDWVFARFY